MGLTISHLAKVISSKMESKILMIGLDGAGKTTILYKLKLGETVPTLPTIGFNTETIQYRNTKFAIWDLGGQSLLRPYWRAYYSQSQSIIFVVDSSDRQRIKEAKEEFHRILEDEELRNKPVLVLANKQDDDAMSIEELADHLELHRLEGRDYHVQGSCAYTEVGLFEGLDWLEIAEKKNQGRFGRFITVLKRMYN